MLFLLLACTDERGPRDPSDVVELDGYVYAGPTDPDVQLTGGTLTFTPEGAEPIAAEQPFVDDYPGYWRADVPASVPYSLRIVGNTGYPAVWRGTAPAADGSWFSGALFGADTDQVDTFLAGLELPTTITPAPLGEGEFAHVWGYPWVAEGWDCALVSVNGEPAICYLQDPTTGYTSRVDAGPFTYFVSLNLLPGEVVVDSGIGGAETYMAEGGDMVFAFWFSATGEGI